MNVNLLTIDSNLAAVANAGSLSSKSDSANKSDRFAISLKEEKQPVQSHEKLTSYNIEEKVRNNKKPLVDSSPELTQSINKKQKSEKSTKTDDKTGLKEQSVISGFIKNQSVIQSRLAESSIAVEQNKEAAPTKSDVKSSHQLAQIITNIQNNKSASFTGNAVKSTEIKVLHTTEKEQLGIKTVPSAKSNGQNGSKAMSSELPKITPAASNQPETTGKNDKTAVSAKTIFLNQKQNGKELSIEASKKSDENTSTPSAKPSKMTTPLMIVRDKTSETGHNSNTIDLEKLQLNAKTDARTKISQNNTNMNSNMSDSLHKESLYSGNNHSGHQGAQKINAEAVQVIAGQTKEQSSSNSNKNSSQGFEQIISQSNSQTLITEQTPVSTKNATTTNLSGRSLSDASADIGKQILESVQKSISQQSTDHQITVRLNPPELGKVLIRFQQQDAELTGLMEVNKTQTRLEIEQSLPQIIRNLADCGIHIKRLEVMLSNEQQQGQGTLGNHSLQSGGYQQQHSTNPGAAGNDSLLSQSNEWLTNNDSYENPSELQGALLTEGSINILI